MKFKFHVDMAKQWEAQRSTSFASHEGRIGAPWNDAERAHLLGGYLQEGTSIARLAARHRRRPAGISAQLNSLMENKTESARLQSLLPKEAPTVNPFQDLITALAKTGNLSGLCNDPNCKGCSRVRAYLGPDKPAEQATPVGPDFRPAQRPNAAAIHAFADNKTVQRLNSAKQWVDYRFDEYRKINVGDPKWQWRVKPLDLKVRMALSERGGIILNSTANIELTFNDGKLVGAKVL